MTLRLVELRVRDLGVIEDVTIEFGPGMTALTGETGAGKTLLVEALGLLLGGRAEPAMVRAGADEAVVEARFSDDDPAADGDGGGEAILARSVARAGRSRAWVDGRMVTATVLGEHACELLELHGQHQHRALVTAVAQRQALDGYGHVDPTPREAARRQVARLTAEMADYGGGALERAREADFLRYQLEEIAAAAIADAGEDDRLAAEEERLSAAEDHRRAAAEALGSLAELEDASALDRMAAAARALAGRDALAPFEERVRALMGDLSDLAGDLRRVVETWEDDPERLAAVAERRQRFRDLARKYGPGLDDVLAYADAAAGRLADMEDLEQRAARLEAELAEAGRALAECEGQVARARRRAAPRLSEDVQARLQALALGQARFEVRVDGEGAADDVTFWLGPNPGEPLQPLARTASGGELARVMLALRLAISSAPPVMVFDEVDAGVGGAAALAVGSALAELGGERQVLVVTHLAQVAAQADQQIAVRKDERDGRTRAEVTALDGDARIAEVSRMLSGRPESTASRRHARDLLQAGRSAL
ncbi:MAG: DNA repair protein RecN [Acidimicrobiales bacterium]|nr:DNA repair protein RecN [Acidimicrobiales bacterium]